MQRDGRLGSDRVKGERHELDRLPPSLSQLVSVTIVTEGKERRRRKGTIELCSHSYFIFTFMQLNLLLLKALDYFKTIPKLVLFF